ncbi:PREDICTED: uncharacterized protein LOC108617782 [Drosophila arizonae]|uniref:Uncharacterized protein LOC108617782 n=1 Tax=Drosophila arizonae TaxID=7263 RepID=A0ABM1PPA4_DROAR|nr:PREDICTED: uncharacterized protein LOC108617782 [Drosophila arizonae]
MQIRPDVVLRNIRASIVRPRSFSSCVLSATFKKHNEIRAASPKQTCQTTKRSRTFNRLLGAGGAQTAPEPSQAGQDCGPKADSRLLLACGIIVPRRVVLGRSRTQSLKVTQQQQQQKQLEL